MMSMQRRRFALAAVLWPAIPALAQGYPSRPIRLIVPFPAAGATDLFARTLSLKMGEKLGTTLVIDNKPGAGGAIGSDLAAKAAPDGYTLLLATTSTHSIGPAISPRLPYDTVRDFTPIGHVGDAPSIMLVPLGSPAKTVREWIDYAKKNPGKLNYASSGPGTIVQLTAELFKAQAGVFVTHIPYKGTALAIPDLMSGKIDLLFDSLPTGLPFVRPPLPTRCPASNPTPGSACTARRVCRPRSWRALTARPTRRWPTPRCARSWRAWASSRPPARRSNSRRWWRRTPPSGKKSSPNATSRVIKLAPQSSRTACRYANPPAGGQHQRTGRAGSAVFPE